MAVNQASTPGSSWLESVGLAVTAGLTEFLDKGKGAPASKKVKGAKASASGSLIGPTSIDGTGITPEGADWVQQCCNLSVIASTNSFAIQVNKRFAPLEDQVAEHDTLHTQTKN